MFSTQHSDKIARNYSYFDGELTQIGSIESRLHLKILLVALLIPLARVRNPEAHRNKKRFLNLISNCTDWTDGDRVSLYQLSFVPSLSSSLRHLTMQSIEKWSYGHMPGLDHEPLLSEVIPMADTEPQRTAIQESRTPTSCMYTEII